MLPIYTAFAINVFAIEGGASQPCIMSVMDENGDYLPHEFVVKVYQQHNRKNTYHEVFGSILADCFELPTPQPALIQVPNNLISEIKSHEKYKNWNIEAGVYFGCQYIPNAMSFNENFPINQYENWICESIFAFDVLIRNYDRQNQKPNLLAFKDDLYVIDHKMAFASIKNDPLKVYLSLDNWQFIINGHRGGHVLRNHLKKIDKKNKIDFADFFENFRTLQPDLLYSYVEQLIEKDVEMFDIQAIVLYLRSIKQNTTIFKTHLENLLRN